MVGINMFFGARKTEYGYAFAGIILASLPIVILFLFLQKYFIKGIVAGAVKG
jgi:ABC-type glycerol-3-phosphate transport system permease component